MESDIQDYIPVEKDLIVKIEERQDGGSLGIVREFTYHDDMRLGIYDKENNKLYTMNNEKNKKKYDNNKYFGSGVQSAVYAIQDVEGKDFVLKISKSKKDYLVKKYIEDIKKCRVIQDNFTKIYFYGTIQYKESTYYYLIVPLYKTFSEIQELNLIEKIQYVKNMLAVLIKLKNIGYHWNDFKPDNIGMDEYFNCIIIDYETDTIIKNNSFYYGHMGINPPITNSWYAAYYDSNKSADISKLNTYMLSVIIFGLIHNKLFNTQSKMENFEEVYVDNIDLYDQCNHGFSEYQLDNLFYKLQNKNVGELPTYETTRKIMIGILKNIISESQYNLIKLITTLGYGLVNEKEIIEKKINMSNDEKSLIERNLGMVDVRKNAYVAMNMCIDKLYLTAKFNTSFIEFNNELKNIFEGNLITDSLKNLGEFNAIAAQILKKTLLPFLEYKEIDGTLKILHGIIDRIKLDDEKLLELSKENMFYYKTVYSLLSDYYKDKDFMEIDLLAKNYFYKDDPDPEIKKKYIEIVNTDIREIYKNLGFIAFHCFYDTDKRLFRIFYTKQRFSTDLINLLFNIHKTLSMDNDYTNLVVILISNESTVKNIKKLIQMNIRRELTQTFNQESQTAGNYNEHKMKYLSLKSLIS